MAEHTPGPWTLQPLDGKYYGTKIWMPDDGEIIVWGSRIWELSERERAAHGPFNSLEDEADWRCDGHYEDARDYANARLIAAAPDMLALLEAIIDDWKREQLITTSSIHRAMTIFAKATGG